MNSQPIEDLFNEQDLYDNQLSTRMGAVLTHNNHNLSRVIDRETDNSVSTTIVFYGLPNKEGVRTSEMKVKKCNLEIP